MLAALYPLERLYPAEEKQLISARLFNMIYMPVIICLIYAIQPSIDLIAGYIVRLDIGLGVLSRLPTDVISISLISLLFAAMWDIWQYWVHRLQHTRAILWPTHKFHHSESAMNASTHARIHLVGHIFHAILWMPMIVALGAIAPHWLVAFVMFRLWGYFIHANIKLHLGVLTPVITGPQLHRIHHSVEPEHQDKNFATFFPVIDIIFGTYYAPARDEFPKTGLADGTRVSFLQDASIEPLKVWYTMLSARAKSAISSY